MKTASCKAKGRVLQKRVAEAICTKFNLPPSDVKSLPMGANGPDIWMSQAALAKCPFVIECKNTESINLHKAFAQAVSHWVAGGQPQDQHPLLVHSKNRSETLAILKLSDLLKLLS